MAEKSLPADQMLHGLVNDINRLSEVRELNMLMLFNILSDIIKYYAQSQPE